MENEVVIKTQLDTKGVEQGAKKVGKELSGMSNKVARPTKAFSKLGEFAKKAFGSVAQHSKGANASIKRFIGLALGFRSVVALFRKMRSVVTEGFKALAKESTEVDSVLSDLKNSFSQFKYQVAAAFQPILTVAAPILQQLISIITEASVKLASFFATLSGQSYIYKATKSTESYAESLRGASKAAKELSNATSKHDELNVIGDSSGGGGGDSSKLFEEVEADESKLANMLKEAWNLGDFTEIGATLSNAIVEGLESLDWGKINKGLDKVASSVSSFLNGIFDNRKLGPTIGTSIGEAINAGIRFVNNLISETDFADIGETITSALYNAFLTLNFGEVGNALSTALKAILDFGSGLLDGIDWASLPEDIVTKLWDLLSGFDWKGAFSSLGNLAGKLLKAVFDFSTGFVEVFGNIGIVIRDFFVEKFNEAGWDSDQGIIDNGKAIIEGLYWGMLEVIANVGMWIHDNILVPFVNGIKSAFQIHSPSVVMQELGIFIISGLYNGINSMITSAIGLFTNLKTKILSTLTSMTTPLKTIVSGLSSIFTSTFSSMATTVKNIFDGMWTSIKGVINIIISGIESFANGIISGINTVIGALNTLSIDVPEWVTDTTGITSFGFNLPELSTVSIPRLAEGAVIPANHEFLAVLGDQTNGTNIEAPLDTIKQAVAEVLGDSTFLRLLADISENTRATAEKDTSVVIGSRMITRANAEGQSQMGRTILRRI